MTTPRDEAEAATVQLLGRVARRRHRLAIALALGGALLGLAVSHAAVEVMVGWSGLAASRLAMLQAAGVAVLTFVVTVFVVLGLGSAALEAVMGRRERRGLERIAAAHGVDVAELEALLPPVGDSAAGWYRRLRIRWAGPRDRSPLRWP